MKGKQSISPSSKDLTSLIVYFSGIEKKANLNQVLNFKFFPLQLVGKLLTLKAAEDVSGHSLYILMMQKLFSLV